MARAPAGDGHDVAEELKKTIGVLRRRRMYFAIGMQGKTPILKTHIKQKPKKLRKDAKGEGAGPKGCSGEIGLNGKVLELYCIEEDVPDAIAKLTTKWLRENGLQYRAMIMPQSIEEPEDQEEGETEEESAEDRSSTADHSGEAEVGAGDRTGTQDDGQTAEEEAAEDLEEAGIETPGASGAAPQSEDTAQQSSAPAGRTREQEQLLSGLRDMQALLTQVKASRRTKDIARMQQFGELFKKAVKQNDARVGLKVLDGMRGVAKQVEIAAKETQKRRKARSARLKNLSSGLQNLINDLS